MDDYLQSESSITARSNPHLENHEKDHLLKIQLTSIVYSQLQTLLLKNLFPKKILADPHGQDFHYRTSSTSKYDIYLGN